ncbi:MAG: hypothetical protein KUG77_10100 [Nannocystaceae bacterium]|nr:hypothetical protein [Nannocystaceae bacterium]
MAYAGGTVKSYPLSDPGAHADSITKLEGYDWGGAKEKLIFSDDPQPVLTIDEIRFVIDTANFVEKVGLRIADPLDAAQDLKLYSLYQVPPRNREEHEHELSTRTTPGWTLRVKVKKSYSS